MKKSKNNIFLCCLMFFVCSAIEAQEVKQPVDVLVKDTTENGEDIDIQYLRNDTTTKSRKNMAKGIDAMDFVLDKRFLNHGEGFTRRWDDHLFLEIGAGVEQMIPPADNYRFQPLTTMHLGLGKQFNKYHSLRLIGEAAYGYQQDKNHIFVKLAGKADYLFSFSSYFNGYNPSRLLDASAVIGAGYQISQIGRNNKGNSYEGHLGLQLRFFTGPQGYFNIEPYVGIASDKMDLSKNRNWRQYDLFYGARLSYIYYIHNNLSPESRLRFMKARKKHNTLSADSMSMQSWRIPWFLEFSNGLSFVKTPQTSLSNSMGHEVTIAVGKWLSPVIGLRVSASSRMSTWDVQTQPEKIEPTYHPAYEQQLNNIYASGRVEALFNPFGFNKNYNWDSPFGMYFVAGAEMGWLWKYEKDALSCRSEAYTAGVHLWARLADGLQVFMEPRLSHNIYRVPYSNVNWEKLFSDDSYTLNMGLTVQTCNRRFRPSRGGDDDGRKSYLVVGLAGGTNLIQYRQSYKGSGLGYNGLAYVEYHLNRVSGVRFSFEYAQLTKKCLSSFYDYPTSDLSSTAGRVSRTGLLDLNYSVSMTSLDYIVNLTNAMYGFRPGRLAEFYLYLGPTLFNRMGRKAELDGSERLQEGHVVKIPENKAPKSTYGVNGGLRLQFNIGNHLGVFFSPHVYILSKDLMPEYSMLRFRFVETLNLGVQYRF